MLGILVYFLLQGRDGEYEMLLLMLGLWLFWWFLFLSFRWILDLIIILAVLKFLRWDHRLDVEVDLPTACSFTLLDGMFVLDFGGNNEDVVKTHRLNSKSPLIWEIIGYFTSVDGYVLPFHVPILSLTFIQNSRWAEWELDWGNFQLSPTNPFLTLRLLKSLTDSNAPLPHDPLSLLTDFAHCPVHIGEKKRLESEILPAYVLGMVWECWMVVWHRWLPAVEHTQQDKKRGRDVEVRFEIAQIVDLEGRWWWHFGLKMMGVDAQDLSRFIFDKILFPVWGKEDVDAAPRLQVRG